jgi:CBS domain-containing protein
MIQNNLITRNIPQLHLEDKVDKGLHLMEDFDVSHLCIIQKDKFIGIISKEDLLSTDGANKIEVLQEDFTHSVILEQEHFSKALAILAEKKLTLIPVLNNDRDFIGVIIANQLLQYTSNFLGTEEQGGIIAIEMERRNYSSSELSRLVETNDAIITQLNTQTNTETGMMTVTIKLNKKEISDIIATLQRYEYNVVAYFGDEAYANEMQENYNHLLHYLNI